MIFTNCVPDKGLIVKIYKELKQLNSKTTNQIKKQAEDMNSHFFPKKVETDRGGQLTHEKDSIPKAIRGIQIKATKRYFTLVRMTILKKTRNNKCR